MEAFTAIMMLFFNASTPNVSYADKAFQEAALYQRCKVLASKSGHSNQICDENMDCISDLWAREKLSMDETILTCLNKDLI